MDRLPLLGLSKTTHEAKSAKELEDRLSRQIGRCIADFSLIEDGDRVLVCVSGGKDSYTLLHFLRYFQRKAPIRFELLVLHIDQGQPGYDGQPLVNWLNQNGVSYRIHRENTYQIVVDKVPLGRTYCSLCSRLRRGIIYTLANRWGYNKVALGHHRDDAVETLLLNLCFNGSLSAMPARYVSAEHEVTVIRPMLYTDEATIVNFAEALQFPILPCNLCSSQETLKRKRMKALLSELESEIPAVRQSMLAAMANVHSSHLLTQATESQVSPLPQVGRLSHSMQLPRVSSEPDPCC